MLLGNDIAVENLWFAQEGNDLSVSLAGTQDAILIKGWYSDDSSRIEEFSSADGRTLLDSRVQVLVDAMAAFAVPAGGESAMTPDLRAQLDVLIAANWQ
ncbi:calcium-binding protein [Stutzerimonas kirkiae]|uniref:calcium-binding protein n=1 Tax=Stutzerimonas kirkiae TaxID=2211392 RepID=UPI0013F1764A|nr:calcium-binding protein [Stutzerimonas kirkiae]